MDLPKFTGEEILWRAQPWDQTEWDDMRPSKRRLSSAGFCASSDGSGMSADLLDECTTIEGYLTRFGPGFGIAEMRVADLVALGATVTPDPLCCNPMHVKVDHDGKQKTRTKIRKVARWVKEPDPPGDTLSSL